MTGFPTGFTHAVRQLGVAGLAATMMLGIGLVGSGAHAQGAAPAGGTWPGATVEAIKKRGQLNCGIDVGVPGFASQDNTGRWQGLDIS